MPLSAMRSHGPTTRADVQGLRWIDSALFRRFGSFALAFRFQRRWLSDEEFRLISSSSIESRMESGSIRIPVTPIWAPASIAARTSCNFD